MALVINDRVKESSTSTGTGVNGDFTIAFPDATTPANAIISMS